jgi:uncharacterized membrane protein required for colicin V production
MHNYIDYAVIIFVIVGFLLGLKDGFIKKFLSLAALVAAIFISITFSSSLKQLIMEITSLADLPAMIVSFISIFVISFILASILSKMLTPKDAVFSLINKFLGGVIGVFQVGFLLSAILILLNFFRFPDEATRVRSHLYNFTYSIIPNTFKFIEQAFPSTKEFFDLIRKANEKEDTILTDAKEY